MPVGLLGSLEVVDAAGRPVEIGGSQARVVLALLIASRGRAVSTDDLIDTIWGEVPPTSAAATLQTYVSRLRRTLAAVDAQIVREPTGYRLEIDNDQLDLHRFEALAERGRAALDAGDPEHARALLVEASDLWRGPALLDVRDRPQVSGLARRLDERRLAALEDRITADIALGRHAALVGELAQLVTDHPLREGFWALLALARYRAGQQGDALRAIAQARHTLVEEMGLEIGPRLRELEAAILAQDQSLDPMGGPPAAGPVPPPVIPAQPRGEPAAVPERAPMIGRDDDRAVLLAAFDEAVAGGASIAVVQGEAGIGKTRLVEELAAHASDRGAQVAWGRSLEGGAAPAYWPWLGVLRLLRAGRPGATDPAVDQLLDATGLLPAAPAADHGSRLLDGVLRLMTPDTPGEPLVMILEDIQWAGAESLELLAQVVAGLEAGPVLLVLTLREGEEADGPAVGAVLAAASRRAATRRLRLRGLEREATDALLAQVHGRPVEVAVAEVVHDRAEGNPFYAIELVRLLESEGMFDDATLARSAVPVGVRDVVRQRLARLPHATVELLQLAAIAGRQVDVGLLSRASGRSIESCLDDLDVAQAHRFLVEADSRAGLGFSHALVREVVVDDLSALRRARVHLLVADAIEAAGRGDDHAEILAEHLWAAALIGVGRRAADALDRAAEVAIRRFAVGAAAGFLERSLELRRSTGSDVDDAVAELDTLTSLVRVLRAQQGYRGGMDHYARGAELARRLGRADVELEMLWAEWAAFDTACEFEQARPAAERFRSWAAESDEPIIQMAGYTTWAIQCWHDGDLTGSYAAFTAADEARAQLEILPDDLSLATELIVLGTGFRLYVAEQVGALDDPEAAFAEAASAVTGNFGVAVTWCFACTSATSIGDPTRVERCARLVLEAEAGETLGFWGSQARMYLGAMLTATGRADEGRPLFETGFTDFRAAGMRVGAALILAAAASAEVLAGDIERANHHLRAAQEELLVGERYAQPAVLLAAADVAEASGVQADEVRHQRQEAETTALAQGAVAVAARARAAQRGESWIGVDAQAPTSSNSPSSA